MRRSNLNHPYIRALARRLGKPTENNSGEIRFNSPFVSGRNRDFSGHLYVNPLKKKFICFKTSTGGSLSYLFALLGEDYSNDPNVPVSSFDEWRSRISSLTVDEKFSIPCSEFPSESIPVVHGSYVYSYLIGRGMTNDDILYYGIREGTREYLSWAIIPSLTESGSCDYWVARRITNDEYGPKYNNPESSRKYHVMFLDRAVKEGNGEIILCEGVFSAIMAGRSSAASLGKFVTNHQIARIEASGVKLVRLCLDGDAWKETIGLSGRLLKRGISVTIIPMPLNKDPADMGRLAFYDHISKNEFRVTDTDLIKLRIGMKI